MDKSLGYLKKNNFVCQVVLHYERGEEGHMFQEVDVCVNRRQGKGLGLSLVGRRDGVGVFVSALVSFKFVFKFF